MQEAAKFLPEVNAQTASVTVFYNKVTQLRLERNYGQAVRLLQDRLAQFHFPSEIDKISVQVELALTQHLAGDTAGAKVTAEQARNTLEQMCKKQPDNPALASLLSLAYATLGEKSSALNEAQRAITLVPSSKDRLAGPGNEENLALVEMIIGDNSRAISTLTRLLQTPYYGGFYGPTPVTLALLRLDPIWDPLRGDPRVEKIVASLAPQKR